MTPVPTATTMQLLAHHPQDAVDRLICLGTRGLFAHVAVAFHGGTMIYEAVPRHGVRAVAAGAYFTRHARREYAAFDVPGADEAAGEAFARTQIGKRYDWRAILGFATLDRRTRERAGYWQCAEFAYAVIARAGVPLFSPERTNPAQLWPSLLPLSPLLR